MRRGLIAESVTRAKRFLGFQVVGLVVVSAAAVTACFTGMGVKGDISAQEPAKGNSYDFGRSFLRWTSTKNNHTPRLQVAAVCTLTKGGKTENYYLSTMCTGEAMYKDRDLIHLPAYEFAMVCVPNDQYMFFKWYGDAKLNMMEVHKVGEAMTTQDGRGAPIVKMEVHMAHHARVRPLTEYAEVRKAILSDKILTARTEYLGEDGQTKVTMEYPVQICNIAHGRERWQVDTGAVLLPDFAAKSELPIGRLRMGYIVFNDWDWAEVIFRQPGSAAAGKSNFTASRRLEVKNRLFCVD